MDSLLTSISINYPLTFLFNRGKIHGFLYSLTHFSGSLKELKKEGEIDFSLQPESDEVKELIRIFLQNGKNSDTTFAEALDYYVDKIDSLVKSKTGQSGQSNPEPIPSASEVQAFIKDGVGYFLARLEGVPSQPTGGSTCYYGVLGLQPGASQNELRTAYEAMTENLRAQGNSEGLARLKIVWEALGNPSERSKYDKAKGHSS
jgi:hypothetical protein